MKKHNSKKDIETIVRNSDHSIEEISKRQDTVETALSDKYDNIIYYDTPGPRINFRLTWGPGKEERVAKTDGSTSNPRASRHMSRGCDTANEWIKMSAFDEPELNHINPILDYFITEENGKEVVITIEKFRKGYVSLDTLLKSSGPLDNRTSEIIFSKYLKAETYLMKKMGLFHRDHKASNMLVRNGETIDFWLIDFTNAVRTDSTTEKYMPTVGGHFITDPLLIGKFTSKEKKYNMQSEIYGMGAEFYHMLTGNYAFEFDPDKGTAVHLESKENVLDGNGTLDNSKYEKLLGKSLHKLKGDKKKWRPFIERLITSKEEDRYQSLDDMAKDFYKTMRKRSISHYFKDRWKTYTAIGALTLASIGLFVNNSYTKEEMELELSKYHVSSEWNAGKMEIGNNFADFNYYIYKTGDMEQNFPEDKFIAVQPGDTLWGTITGKEFGRQQGGDPYMRFNAKIFFEGYNSGSKDISFITYSHDESKYYDSWMSGDMGGYFQIIVPKDLRKGLTNLIVEVYPPQVDENSEVVFNNPDKAIYRKKNALVHGDVSQAPTVRSIQTSIYRNLIIENPTGSYPPGLDTALTYEVSIPELGLAEENKFKNGFTGGILHIPKAEKFSEGVKTLQVVSKLDGTVIGMEFVPLEMEKWSDDYFEWKTALPDSNFYHKIADLKNTYMNNNFKQ